MTQGTVQPLRPVSYPGLEELPLADDLCALHHVLAGSRGDALLDTAVARGGGQVAGQPRVNAVRTHNVRGHVAAIRLSKGCYELTLYRKDGAMSKVRSRRRGSKSR